MFQIKTNPMMCQNINPIRLQLVYYGRAQVDENWKGSAASPVNSRLFCIVSGEGCMRVDKNRQIKLEAGNWYLFPAGCSFSYSCKESLDHIYIHLSLCDTDGIDLLHQCREPLEMTATDDDVDFFSEGLTCQSVVESLRVRHRIYDLLLTFMEDNRVELASRKLSPCVSKAIAYIRENLSVRLSNSEIAEQANVSVSTLTKRFQRELSMSVHDYIENLVFSEAVRLIRQSDMPIGRISEKFGFCDQFYFSRRFKEKIGTAPRNYRRVFV